MIFAVYSFEEGPKKGLDLIQLTLICVRVCACGKGDGGI